MARSAWPLSLAIASFAVACGGSGSPGGFPVASHAPLPGVNDSGGGILAAPKIVTVTFDPGLYTGNATPAPATLVADLEAFDDSILASPWWDAVRAGYCEGSTCVGRGTAGAHVSLTGANAPAATSFTDSVAGQNPSTLQPYIASLLASGALPAPDPSTLYLFYFPLSLPITLDGAVSCESFGGYHDTLAYEPAGGAATIQVPYAVVSICDPEQTRDGVPRLSLEGTATMAASHEIVETVTDPYAGEIGKTASDTSMLGYNITTSDFLPWALTLHGGEVADLCTDVFGFGADRWTQGTSEVTRVWSNPSAAASHDPCVPIPAGEAYFNAAPAGGNDALAIAVGKSVTFEIDAFADGPTADWTLGVIDLDGNVDPRVQSAGDAGSAACDPGANIVCFTLGETTVNNGAKVSVTATLNAMPPSAAVSMPGTTGFEPYVIFSFSKTSTTFHVWPGVVVAAAATGN